MSQVLHLWPYVGLLLATGIVAFLAFERRTVTTPRWSDPGTVLGLLLPVYAVHQFEEHGVDVFGRRYAFLADFCDSMGYGPGASVACPADATFLFAVNAVGVWTAGALALALRRRRPLVAACAWGIAPVNALTHIVGAVRFGRYNPGVVSGVVLFLPMTVYLLHTLRGAGSPLRQTLPRIVGLGVLVHAVLLVSMTLRARGLLPYPLFVAVNGLNGLCPLLVGGLGARSREVSLR